VFIRIPDMDARGGAAWKAHTSTLTASQEAAAEEGLSTQVNEQLGIWRRMDKNEILGDNLILREIHVIIRVVAKIVCQVRHKFQVFFIFRVCKVTE
jgi:hypothetical protein